MNLIAKIYLTPDISYFQDFSYFKNINEIIYLLNSLNCDNYDIIETILDFDHYEQLFDERKRYF